MTRKRLPVLWISVAALSILSSPCVAQEVTRISSENSLILREIGVVASFEEGALEVLTLLPEEMLPAASSASQEPVELQRGDQLLMLNGERLADLESARARYQQVAVGDLVKLAVRRDNERFLVAFPKLDESELEGAGRHVMVQRIGVSGGAEGVEPVLGLGVVVGDREGSLTVLSVLPIGDTALAAEDVIVRINGGDVTTPAEIQEIVEAAAAGEVIEVTVLRGDVEETVGVEKLEMNGRVMMRSES